MRLQSGFAAGRGGFPDPSGRLMSPSPAAKTLGRMEMDSWGKLRAGTPLDFSFIHHHHHKASLVAVQATNNSP